MLAFLVFTLLNLFRFVRRILLLPLKLAWRILRNPAYNDKVLYYSLDYSRHHIEHKEPQTIMPVEQIGVISGGGGFYGVSKRGYLDLSGMGGGAETSSGDYSLHTGSGEGSAHIGFKLKLTRRLRVYPYLGIGGAGSGTEIKHPSETGNPTIHQQGYAGVIVPRGVLVEYRIGGRFGMAIGARLGLHSRYPSGKLKSYVRLFLGVGRFLKDNDDEPEQPIPVNETAAPQ